MNTKNKKLAAILVASLSGVSLASFGLYKVLGKKDEVAKFENEEVEQVDASEPSKLDKVDDEPALALDADGATPLVDSSESGVPQSTDVTKLVTSTDESSESAQSDTTEKQAEPTEQAQSALPGDQQTHTAEEPKNLVAGNTVSLGTSAVDVEKPKIERYNNDKESRPHVAATGFKAAFSKGSEVKETVAREESISYVYLSRGAWLIRNLRPFLDRIAVEIVRNDSSEVWANYVEVSRSFNYLCLLIASDDGSDAMTKKIANAVSIHRESVSNLKIQWSRKSDDIKVVLDEYIEATFLKNVDDKAVRIPAGSLSAADYKSFKTQYKDELSKPNESGIDAFPSKLMNPTK